jgi:hypothetical protein
LQVRPVKPGAWVVEGKVWADGGTEPAEWTVKLDVAEEPPTGKAAVWCAPFSNTPVRFDDVTVAKVPGS